MKCYGRARVADLVGDTVVYRSLQPADPTLPGFKQLARSPAPGALALPRKGEESYAAAVAAMIRSAQQRRRPGVAIDRLIYVGDTRMSDGGAFVSLRVAGGWGGRAFICAEEPSADVTLINENEGISTARRWAALARFAAELDHEGFAWSHTAVVLDLDKTLIGARGRNSHVIDRARMAALRTTVASLLAGRFDEASFERVYSAFNRPAFHPFTGDNQDYLAYLCLMIGASVVEQAEVEAAVAGGALRRFEDLLDRVDASPPVDEAVAETHREVAWLVRRGDPTPFKNFRRREFRETAALMGCAAADTPAQRLLDREIVLTAEVWVAAMRWKEAGALLMALSDKPDEAAYPTAEDAAAGGLPLHRIETHIVGE
ncbi:MAG: hypothetical protein HYX75_21000 [Acidobacteria bacterium]|nr:hypothetical protein [Acidobacteriota bacterium]